LPALLLTLAATGCARAVATEPAHAERREELADGSPRTAAARVPEEPDPGADAQRGWLGVELGKRDTDEPGVIVRDVLRGSPAARSGLTKDDVLTSVDGQSVSTPDDVSRVVGEKPAGKRISVAFNRQGEARLVAVELAPFPSSDGMMRKAFVGAKAPQLEALKSVQGSLTPSWETLRGRVVVMEFWASWCMVCQMMLPTLNGWHERYSAQGVTVVGVTPEPVELASRAAYELGMAYPVFSDDTGATSRSYRAQVIPMVFVIDKQGEVRDVVVGYSSDRLAKVETLVKKLVDER
jgi:thiol-disulfide isomerase/thioredoxin